MVSFGQRPFLTEAAQLDSWKPDVAVVGAPFDVGTTNRPGARFGPARHPRHRLRARHLSHGSQGLEIFDWLEVVDFGDAYCPHGQTDVSHANIRERVHTIASRGIVPLILGGDHSITWPAATAVADATATATWASSISMPTPTPPTSSRATWPATAPRCVGSSSPARCPERISRSDCAATGPCRTPSSG